MGIEPIVIQLTVLVELIIVVGCCEQYYWYYYHLETLDREVFDIVMNLLSVVLFMWIELTTIQSSTNGILA